MRSIPVAALLCLAIAGGAGEAPPTPAPAADAARSRTAFVNARIVPPSRQVALNQAVKVEFTTMPRQVGGVDIAAAVANAIALDTRDWRQLQPPAVVEHDKTKTVTVVMTLLPRVTGDLALPPVPLTWLGNDQLADLGMVTVADHIAVGSDRAPMPKEVQSVAGFAWGAKLADLSAPGGALEKARLDRRDDRIVAVPQPGLELVFRGGELGEAALSAAGLTLERAKDQFLRRWGLPQGESAEKLTWIIGWTRIEAIADGDGVKLLFIREDIQSRLDRTKVEEGVFKILDR